MEDKDRIQQALSRLSSTTSFRILLEDDEFPAQNESSFLESMLQNIRDVKRFLNSFKLSFQSLKEFADVTDLMILELIKTRHVDVYQKLSNKSYLTRYREDHSDYFYKLNKPAFLADFNVKSEDELSFEIKILLESLN